MRQLIILAFVGLCASSKCPEGPKTCKMNERMCWPSGAGKDGCMPSSYCIPSKVQSLVPGKGMCDNPCEPHCGDHETYCQGGTDYNGCKLAGYCQPRTEGTSKCPQTCMPSCQPDETICPGKMNSDGCRSPDKCVKKSKKVMIEYECPSFCPAQCEPDQLTCTNFDQNGCEMPPACLSGKAPNLKDPSKFCPNHCPPMCKGNEISCSGPVGADGCPGMSFCVGETIGKNNEKCMPTCPVYCSTDEIMCSTDYMGGCPMHTCIPRFINNSTCQNFCPVSCSPDQVMCPGTSDVNGCRAPDMCLPMQYGKDGMSCPMMSSCPISCPNGMFLCPLQQDSNGCTMHSTCVSNLNECPKSG